jgi:hypothetical protein
MFGTVQVGWPDQPATTIATTEIAKRQLMARDDPRCRE